MFVWAFAGAFGAFLVLVAAGAMNGSSRRVRAACLIGSAAALLSSLVMAFAIDGRLRLAAMQAAKTSGNVVRPVFSEVPSTNVHPPPPIFRLP